VKQTLLSSNKQIVPITDFYQLTKTEFGRTQDEANQLLQSLSNEGVILHHSESTNPHLRNNLFINPQQVTNFIAQSFDRYLPQLNQEQIDDLRKEYQRLTSIKDQLDLKAETRSNVLIWAGFGYCVFQAAILARLTWWEFSWDVTEPITYFITFGTGLLSYMYFATLKSEYTYDNLRDRLIKRRKNKYYAREDNFSIEKWNQLHEFFQKFDRKKRSALEGLVQLKQKPSLE